MTDASQDFSLAERIESICDRFERDFRAGKNPNIERCLGESNEPFRSTLFQAVLNLEIALRQQRGEKPQLEEYQSRFPKHGDLIQQAFTEVHSIVSSVKVSSSETSEGPIASVPATSTDSQPLKKLGRFQILSVLGEGAFGTVYKAHDPQLDRDVAIKVPRFGAAQSTADRERFLREARAAAGLQHAQICPVFEVGTIENRDYIVMAFIDGKPMSKVIQTQSKLTDKQIVSVIRKIALGLVEAHEKGIIHRDLKPANILINRKGDPVIMDFGLARRSNSSDAQISQSGQIMGTPAYMSPEQARGDGKSVGASADVYSLGVILYELLCGRRPFEGTITEVIGKILHVDIEPPSKYRSGVDKRLEQICLKAIAKKNTDRYQSMNELASALAEYLKAGSAVQQKTSSTIDTKTQDDDDQFVKMMAAMSGLEEKVERAASRAVRKTRKRQKPPVPWWLYLAGSGVMGLILLFGILFIIRKGTVTVIVNIPIDYKNDPSLTFVLDNKAIAPETFDAPIELKPGEHELIVNKDDKLFKKFRFSVGKLNNQKVKVEDVTPPPSPPPPPDVEPVVEKKPSGPGWIELFNGKDLSNWVALDGKSAEWKVENGHMEIVPGTKSIMTRDSFPLDVELHAEFWLPKERDKRDQARANSGIYLLGRHEIQICDGYENPISNPKVACGALYAEIPATSNPGTPPETWQTLDINFRSPRFDDQKKVTTPGRLTVVFNGSKVVDDAPFSSANSGQPQNVNVGQPGPIVLQDHGSKVRFRNLRIRPLKPLEFVPLFPGDSLSGWQCDPVLWSLKNGVLTGQSNPAKKHSFLFSEKLFSDFELMFQVTTLGRDNSGVQVRSEITDRAKWILRGPQADIGSEQNESWGGLYGELGPQWIVQPEKPPTIRSGDWNDYFLRCQGKRVTIQVNGETTVDGLVADIPASGVLGFQVHGNNRQPVGFRQIMIHVMKSVEIPADAQTFNGHSYKFYGEQLPWNQARAKCEALGGHLIIVDSLEENSFAAKLVEAGGWIDAWIGATDEEKEGEWKTVFGNPLPFVNWGASQPNNKPPGEHWALISNMKIGTETYGWKWSDQPNQSTEHKPGYVCEWDAPPRTAN